MQESIYTALLILLEIAFSVIILVALKRAGAKISVIFPVSMIFVVWLTAIYLALTSGFYSSTGMPQLAFFLSITLPVVIGYVGQAVWRPLGEAIQAMSTQQFLVLQQMRAAFGVMFFFTSALPVWFQWIGGLGDIAAGLVAFLALQSYRRQPTKEREAILRGNIIGILDFVVVLNLGLFVVLKHQSPDIIFDLIPLYVVPLFILLHIFSLQRLSRLGVDADQRLAGTC